MTRYTMRTDWCENGEIIVAIGDTEYAMTPAEVAELIRLLLKPLESAATAMHAMIAARSERAA